MNVVRVIEHYRNFIVTANIDGDFDKRELLESLLLAPYFTPHNEQIVQLIISAIESTSESKGSARTTVTSQPYCGRVLTRCARKKMAAHIYTNLQRLTRPPGENGAMLPR
jgi:hypothetical protein